MESLTDCRRYFIGNLERNPPLPDAAVDNLYLFFCRMSRSQGTDCPNVRRP
jgi:hypothetical protein